ncbi:MAG: protease modulator HflC [Burkholderiales bacterium]|nr:MAG: protease modulator HflC [Burkholderiales bacterium]
MNRIVPALLGLLVALGVASTMLFVVDQRQYAVVFALGEIKEVIAKPGLHFKLPPPFQNVQYFDNRILTIDTADVDRFITSEKLNVQIDTFVKWRIADPRRFFTSVGGSELIASDRLQRSLRDSLNNEIARRTVSEVISGKRQELLDLVRNKMNEDAKQIGAEIIDVRLKRVDFAPEVSEQVFARMQSERKRVANERRATGSAESEKIRADADRQRDVIIAEAYRDAQRVKGEGDAKASSLFAEAFGQNPEFASFYRSLEAYRTSFRNRSDVLVLDPQSEFFRYFRGPGAGQSASSPSPRK